ncbi:RNA polymerase sigma-70 factor [Chitinophaga sp. Mgbs1]|uniref:RNA polymerase sigma-70 factor n=1 Tax=Chitinophaga solisilvae TaxID=1233460 RepID=A0A433WGA7_9BACT|nr:RNA polymerase sigma-70 factor [Chitinophaga solisilvae]
MLNATDEALCKKIIEKDEPAFRILYDRYRNQIYAYALKLCGSTEVALDAVQEVFMKIWIRHESLDPSLSLKAYLYRSARNYIFDYLKKAVHDEKFRAYFLQAYEENTVGDACHVLYTKQLEEIRMNAVSRLPSQRQLIYRMSKVDGCSNQEIADRLGISVNTVRDQLVKASRYVRHYLSENADLAVLLAIFTTVITD